MTAPPHEAPGLSNDLAAALEAAGQAHIVEALARLSDEERPRLLGQIGSVDWNTVGDLRRLVIAGSPPMPSHDFQPPDVFALDRDASQRERASAAVAEGERLLAAGKVACVVVAGGQASRLGLDGPKGTVPAGPVTGRSLFELFARKLEAAHLRYGRAVPFYVMTSPANHETTQQFFAAHDFFGLEPGNVVFFTQGSLPALDEAGQALFSARNSLALAPTGHGGVFSALADSGSIADLQQRGIELLSYFQVDNPLVLPADPLFLGLHSLETAGMSSKVVRRRSADEKVGVIARIDGHHGCIEYSNLPEALRGARNEDGALRFSVGNIAMHIISVDFAATTVGSSRGLPWTLAHKRMRVVDRTGQPAEQMAYKAERFVFDALGLSQRTVTLEVDRSTEFSPIKNASGENSPATSRRDMCALYGRWVEAAGEKLPAPDSDGVRAVEVDPRFAQNEAEFLAAMPAEPVVLDRGHFYTGEA